MSAASMTPKPLEYLMVFSGMVVSLSWVADIGSDLIQLPFYFLILIGIAGSGKLLFQDRFISILGLVFAVLLAVLVLQGGLFEPRSTFFIVNLLLGALIAGAFQGRSYAFMRAFNSIIYLLLILSFLALPFLPVQGVVLVKLPDFLLSGVEHKSHRSLQTFFGISYFVSNGSGSVWRNQSIFWEPGLFACMLTIAMMFSDALGETSKRWYLYLIGILTTFTPGGYGIMLIYLGFRSFRAISRRQAFFVLVAVAVAIATYTFLPFLRTVILFLFSRDIQTDSSVLIRSTDAWLPFYSATNSPLYGHATFEHYQDMMMDFIQRRREGMSNALGEYFYRYGFIFSAVWLFALSQGLKNYPRLAGLSFPVILAILCYEPIGFSVFFSMFVLCGLNGSKHSFPSNSISLGTRTLRS